MSKDGFEVFLTSKSFYFMGFWDIDEDEDAEWRAEHASSGRVLGTVYSAVSASYSLILRRYNFHKRPSNSLYNTTVLKKIKRMFGVTIPEDFSVEPNDEALWKDDVTDYLRTNFSKSFVEFCVFIESIMIFYTTKTNCQTIIKISIGF